MEAWYQKAAEKMARENKTLFQVSNEMDLGLTSKESQEVEKLKEFGICLRGERLKFYKEMASDPNRGKESLVGQMFYLADRLMAKDSDDKAATVLLNISKILGYTDASTSVNIFGTLTQGDLDTMKKKLKEGLKESVN